MVYKKLKLFLISILFCTFSGVLFASSSGFQIAPPPIAYPYFEEGRVDLKIEPIFISIESADADLSLSGAGFNFIRRDAISDFLAFDMQGAMFVLVGEMPGFAMYPSAYYYASPDGNADTTMTSMLASVNIEMQVIKEDEGSLILFIGPNFGFNNMTMTTPYSLISYSTGEVYPGYTNVMSILSTTVGVQYGMQASLSLGQGMSISPFFMSTSISGTSTMTNDPGTSDTEASTYTADMPSTTTTSFGMDIIINEISIGTILQNIKQEDESPIDIVMFRFGFSF